MKKRLKTIRGSITILVVVCTIIILYSAIIFNALRFNSGIMTTSKQYITNQAVTEAQVIDEWLGKQAQTVETLAASIEASGYTQDDREAIEACLEKSLAGNSEALMYYCCFGYNGGVFPANHIDLDLDPTTRGWWIDSTTSGTLIYTDPYKDFATGQMIVSIAKPVTLGGEQAVVLADITLDTLIATLDRLLISDEVQAFLLASDGSVVVHNNADFLPKEEGNTLLQDQISINIGELGVQQIKDYDGQKKIVALHEIASTGWILGVAETKSSITSTVDSSFVEASIIGIALIVVTTILLNAYLKKKFRPIDDMKDFVKDTVLGTDANIHVDSEAEEIDFLVQQLQIRFVNTIRKTKEESTVIFDKMNATGSSIKNMSGSITEISAIMEETGANVELQTESIKNIGVTCNEVTVAVERLAEQAQQMAEKSGDIEERVEAIVPGIKEDKEHAVNMSIASKERLEDAIKGAEVINEIVGVSESIQSIATQTNLLALNASIEAARAGAAGRGFAVVAEEIKNLSSTTSEEIAKVNALTSAVLSSVATLSKESNDLLAFINDTVLVDYNKLESLADNYKADAEYYANISSELGAGAEELSASIMTIDEVLSEVSTSQDDLNAAMQSINGNLQEIASGSEMVSTQTGDVMDSVGSLQSTMGTFKV